MKCPTLYPNVVQDLHSSLPMESLPISDLICVILRKGNDFGECAVFLEDEDDSVERDGIEHILHDYSEHR